ncbi:MAG: histidine phosphatase family protein [Bacteroidota bacterium]
MKKLLLIRHAKATHESGLVDFERPLKMSGLQDAAIMAGRLKAHSIVPQLLVSSPALRTISTANVFLQHLSITDIEENAVIYEASQEKLVDIINEFNDAHNFIGLVGHNPGIQQVLYYLTGSDYDVPPGAVALIEFDVAAWGDVAAKNGRVVYYDTPND